MPSTAIQPLQGIRILSLALNLPGPAALWRCAGMGADCRKLEPLAPVQAAAPTHGPLLPRCLRADA